MKKFLLFTIILSSFCTLNSFAQAFGWMDISANIPAFPYDTIASLIDVFFVNDNEGWITTNHPYNDTAAILHTMDGGETFEVQTTLFSCNAIQMLNENEGYAGGKSGFVYRTVDGGDSWNFHGTILQTLADISFAPSDSIGYCCGLNGTIGKITQDGVTQMNSGVPDGLYGITFPINSTEGWVCGGSIIRHFINESWTAADQDYPSGGFNAIFMFDTLNGWAVGDNGIIAHTTDGKNWFEQTNPDPDSHTFCDVFFLNSNEGWAVGSSWLIEHTTNGGEGWTIQNIGSLYEPAFTGIHFTSPTNGYVVGNGKTLLKYGTITSVENEEQLPSEFSLSQNYPNPFNPATKIKFTIPTSPLNPSPYQGEGQRERSVTLKVYDVLGNEVATLVDEYKPAGNYEVEFRPNRHSRESGNLSSGIYFYQLKAGEFIQTKKMILMK